MIWLGFIRVEVYVKCYSIFGFIGVFVVSVVDEVVLKIGVFVEVKVYGFFSVV